MSLDLLGEGFDIHGGGDDLIFPHHENERAEALGCGREFAKYWIHNGMVQVDGEKMSKSLGNFTTLEAMLDHWDPRALRLLVLQTHYRHTMEIGADALDGAVSALDRLDVFADRFRSADLGDSEPDRTVVAKFNEAMDDDLGTPTATAVIFDAVREANRHLDESDSVQAASLGCAVETLMDVLGLKIGRDQRPSDSKDSEFDENEIEGLIIERNQAREGGNYARADEIRDSLFESGIVLEDSAQGTTWHRS
jgi:cysteinyl-tRNA synthetase